MIGKLKGKLIEIENNEGLIETASGVSYKVWLTPNLLTEYKIGDNIEIYTYLQVREDNLSLFGFEDKKKYQLFLWLIQVDGVGPKSGFNIISFSDSESIFDAVSKNNVDFFQSIPGVGKKTAQKILLELSSKIGAEFDVKLMHLSAEDVMVVEALTSLGFKKYESQRVLANLKKDMSVEEKIRDAIKFMTKK